MRFRASFVSAACLAGLAFLPLLPACKMNSGESIAPESKAESVGKAPPASSAPSLAEGHANPSPAASAAPQAPMKLGEPITADVVALSEIAKNPGAFKGKTIATTGKVAAVCQEKGCWLELADTEHHANVRMHGHAFFVPRSSSGKSAKVQGTVVLKKDGKECEEMEATGAKLELDATGVELL